MTDPRDDFAAIPILLEPVPEPQEAARSEPPADAETGRESMVRAPVVRADVLPGRAAQQSLFDDAPSLPSPLPRRVARRPPPSASPSPTLQRLAEEMLRAKAPAIIDELVDEHARRLSAELRERLRRELVRLIAELAGQEPEPGAAGPAPDMAADRENPVN